MFSLHHYLVRFFTPFRSLWASGAWFFFNSLSFVGIRSLGQQGSGWVSPLAGADNLVLITGFLHRQRVERVQNSHHFPYIWWEKNRPILVLKKFFGAFGARLCDVLLARETIMWR